MEYYRQELQKRGVTKTLLWQEYRKDNPQGYGHSQFSWYLLEQQRANKAVFKMQHKPAQQMMIEFAGDKMSYVDPVTGELIECELLVCVLPFSGMTYAEALRSQQIEDFIKGICNALRFFGGVPLSIKCDNLKSAVIRSDRYAKSSVIVASQLPIKNWYEYFNDPTIADAILDRLTAKYHRNELKGDSLRKKSVL